MKVHYSDIQFPCVITDLTPERVALIASKTNLKLSYTDGVVEIFIKDDKSNTYVTTIGWHRDNPQYVKGAIFYSYNDIDFTDKKVAVQNFDNFVAGHWYIFIKEKAPDDWCPAKATVQDHLPLKCIFTYTSGKSITFDRVPDSPWWYNVEDFIEIEDPTKTCGTNPDKYYYDYRKNKVRRSILTGKVIPFNKDTSPFCTLVRPPFSVETKAKKKEITIEDLKEGTIVNLKTDFDYSSSGIHKHEIIQFENLLVEVVWENGRTKKIWFKVKKQSYAFPIECIESIVADKSVSKTTEPSFLVGEKVLMKTVDELIAMGYKRNGFGELNKGVLQIRNEEEKWCGKIVTIKNNSCPKNDRYDCIIEEMSKCSGAQHTEWFKKIPQTFSVEYVGDGNKANKTVTFKSKERIFNVYRPTYIPLLKK